MSKAQRVITAVVLEGRSKTDVARDYEVSRQWVHELVRRYTTEGAAAFVARSRRPHRNPHAVGAELEERIIELRKTLSKPAPCRHSTSCYQVQLDRSALPAGRVIAAFTFPEERPAKRRFWFLIEHDDAELCHSDPGGHADLTVEARSWAFVDWHRGARTWRDVLRAGDITLIGRSGRYPNPCPGSPGSVSRI